MNEIIVLLSIGAAAIVIGYLMRCKSAAAPEATSLNSLTVVRYNAEEVLPLSCGYKLITESEHADLLCEEGSRLERQEFKTKPDGMPIATFCNVMHANGTITHTVSIRWPSGTYHYSSTVSVE